jgi:hypothetical protein
MVGSLLAASAAMALAQSVEHGRVTESDRPIATLAPYPANMADSVRRPGFNGRLFVGRPIIGGMDGPYPLGWDSPGPEYYGAFDNQEALVYSRTGLITISMNPWEEIRPENLRALREAQQFWLKEQGYVGGVRTHVNDLYAWKREGGLAMLESDEPAAEPKVLPEPRMIFEVPADVPRMKSRIKVEARPVRRGPEAIVVLSNEPVRISWPMNAPANTVARAEAREATSQTASR